MKLQRYDKITQDHVSYCCREGAISVRLKEEFLNRFLDGFVFLTKKSRGRNSGADFHLIQVDPEIKFSWLVYRILVTQSTRRWDFFGNRDTSRGTKKRIQHMILQQIPTGVTLAEGCNTKQSKVRSEHPMFMYMIKRT